MSVKRKKLILAIALIFAVNLFIIALAQSADAALYKRGSSGATVTQIQTRLKSWGYYNYTIDGIYGSRTENAVKYFQRKNGLTVDGQAGDKTLAAMGIYEQQNSSANNGDVYLLARLISAEARGEPYVGQVAVGAVVINRIDHPSFPNSLSGVIYQSGAFSCLDDGQFNQPISDSAFISGSRAPEFNPWNFFPGDKVRHRKFGVGTVLKLVNAQSKTAASAWVQVSCGRKELLLMVAKLEKVS